MSEPIDDKALEEYLSRDSELSRRYRELGGNEVPPELDRRILEEARSAVQPPARRGSSGWSRWAAPVALAASLVLALAVVIESGLQVEPTELLAPTDSPADVSHAGSERQAAQAQEPAPLQSASEAAQTRASESPEAGRETVDRPMSVEAPELAVRLAAPDREGAARAQSEQRRSRSGAAAPSLAYSPPRVTVDENAGGTIATLPPPELVIETGKASAPRSSSIQTVAAPQFVPEEEFGEVVVTGTARKPERTFGGRDTAARSQLRPADASSAAAYATPEEWLEAIRRLRKAGKTEQADREWERFLEAYPSYSVAPDDPARKPSPEPDAR
ncbi:MAG TPA: hypothetical protein VF193_15970 [Steroidobacter sp.]